MSKTYHKYWYTAICTERGGVVKEYSGSLPCQCKDAKAAMSVLENIQRNTWGGRLFQVKLSRYKNAEEVEEGYEYVWNAPTGVLPSESVETAYSSVYPYEKEETSQGVSFQPHMIGSIAHMADLTDNEHFQTLRFVKGAEPL